MKNIFNKYSLIFDLLFIFILSLTPLLWFKKDTLMLGHDNVFPLDAATFLSGRLYTWIEQGFGQSQSLIMGTIPIHLIDAIPYFLGFSIQTTQKIVYIFWFFLMGISAYVLASVLNKNSRVFKFTAIVFYIFNFFILQAWWIGERTKFSAYIAFPFIIAIFIQVYRKKLNVIKAGVLFALILFLFNGGGFYGISLYGGLFIGLGSFIIFFSTISFFHKEYSSIKRFLIVLFIALLGFLLLNSYYLFPAISKTQGQYNSGLVQGGGILGFLNWADEISANASFINILRLQGIAEWYDNPEHPYSKYFLTNPSLIAFSFLWPILIFLSLIFKRKKENQEMILYFFLVFLLGIFFTAGTHPPLGFLYETFMKYIPGSIAFRSPYFKFAPAIFLAASFLIAYFVDYFNNLTKKIVFSLLILTVLVYHFPYFTGNFFTWRKGYSTRLTIPQYVFDFSKWINTEKKDDGRILILPPNNPDFQYSMYNWGYLSFQSLPTLFSNESVIINNDRIYTEERNLILSFYEAILNNDAFLVSKLSKLLRIRYIALQKDIYNDPKSNITTDYKVYEHALDKFRIKQVRNFGQWDIYRIDENILPQIFVSNNISLLEGKELNESKYFYFFENPPLFFKSSDKSLISSIFFRKFWKEEYYVPNCLNCPNKNRPLITFPQRSILPDSPLYEFVIFNEKRKIGNKDTKSEIYDNLGTSLKRLSEIRQLIFENKNVPKKVINSYISLLDGIKYHFKKLEKFEDKFQVADDLNYYMDAQRNFLLPTLGSYITTGDKAVILGKVFQKITSVKNTIEPYIFKLDPLNNRLYQFYSENDGIYELYLRKRDFDSVLKEDTMFKVLIDEKDVREVKYDRFDDLKWYNFGLLNLTQGSHQLLLSFPETPNIIEDLKLDKTEFNDRGENICYTGRIKEYSNKSIYKLTLNYKNDFSEDLYLYIWELKSNEKLITDVTKLKTSLAEEEFSSIIKSYGNSKGFAVGLCSKALTKDVLNKKVKVKISEMIYPDMILTSKAKKITEIQNINFKRVTPTKYTISLTNSNNPSVLAFMSRFDEGWILSGFEKNHFRVNGYANGWVIDKSGKLDLVLEYKTQKIFYYGVIISIFFFLLSVFYLLNFYKIKKN